MIRLLNTNSLLTTSLLSRRITAMLDDSLLKKTLLSVSLCWIDSAEDSVLTSSSVGWTLLFGLFQTWLIVVVYDAELMTSCTSWTVFYCISLVFTSCSLYVLVFLTEIWCCLYLTWGCLMGLKTVHLFSKTYFVLLHIKLIMCIPCDYLYPNLIGICICKGVRSFPQVFPLNKSRNNFSSHSSLITFFTRVQ